MKKNSFHYQYIIKITLNKEEIDYLNKLYIDNEIYNISGYDKIENKLGIRTTVSEKIFSIIKFKNKFIYIDEYDDKNNSRNKKVINYLNEIN